MRLQFQIHTEKKNFITPPVQAELLLLVSAGISSVVHQVQALQLLSLLLPEANRDTLRVNPNIYTDSQLRTQSVHQDVFRPSGGVHSNKVTGVGSVSQVVLILSAGVHRISNIRFCSQLDQSLSNVQTGR